MIVFIKSAVVSSSKLLNVLENVCFIIFQA